VKDYLQRRYLEQISEHQTRKDTFLKCRSDDLSYRSFKRQHSSGLVQSFEYISKDPPDHSPLNSSVTGKSDRTGVGGKACSFDSSSVHLQHSVSDTNLCCVLSASDTNFIQSQIIRSPSKRGLLQRGVTIDMEDAPGSNIDDERMTSSPTSPIADEKNDAGKITFSIDRPDDDDDDDDREQDHQTCIRPEPPELKSPLIPANLHSERKSRPFRHSHSDQPTSDSFGKGGSNQFLGPYRHSFEHQHDNRNLPVPQTGMPYHTGVHIPLAPYSASSDPGPYQSPWSHTPPNPYGLMNFHFPKSQEQLVASAQGSIAQLSTLTKILCDEPSVFTPITPR
jgi:hypothetical protein